MEALTKQRLLMNAMTFAQKSLTSQQFTRINPSQFDYRVSGETDLVDFKLPGLWLQSYIYSDNTTKTLIFDGRVVHSS